MISFISRILAITTVTHGWGGEILRIITERAYARIKDMHTLIMIADLIGNREQLVTASNWADSEEARSVYPGSEDLHFSHTPWRRCQPFVIERDCGSSSGCIVTGIADMVLIVLDKHRPQKERADALKFVIHFMGDIHQPLHTGFAEDAGGVSIKLGSEPRLSLHQMWDYGLTEQWAIPSRSPKAESKKVDPVKAPTDITSYETVLDFATEIATESTISFTCDLAYKDESGNFIRSGSQLSQAYIDSRRSIIVDRIDAASTRLVKLLQAMAKTLRGNFVPAPTRPPVESSPKSANRFATLEMDFDPEDYLVDLSGWISPNSRSKQHRQTKDRFAGLENLVSQTPTMINGVNVTDIILTKINEQYVITRVRKNSRDKHLGITMVSVFRVKFSRNRIMHDPFSFLVDAKAFPFITGEEVLKIILYMRGIPENEMGSLVKSVHGNLASVEQVRTDVTRFAPIDGEFSSDQFLNLTNRDFLQSRGWDKEFTGNHLYYALITEEILRMDEEEYWAQMNRTGAQSRAQLSLYWDYQVATKLTEIVFLRLGSIQAVFLKSTLRSGSVSLNAMVHPCVDASGLMEHFFNLIDIEIMYGDLTDRSTELLNRIARKQPVSTQTEYLQIRPSLENELKDLDLIFTGKARDRWKQIKSIKGFSLIPTFTAPNHAMIMWRI